MTATFKAVSAVLLAAILSLALFLSPVGISRAQDDTEDETTTAPADEADDTTTDEDATDRPGRGDRTPLTEEEMAARQAEREAARAEYAQALADELGVTVDALQAAFQTVAIDQVNARVDAGDLTQERADEIIANIESGEGFSGLGGRGNGSGRGHGGHGQADADAATDGEDI